MSERRMRILRGQLLAVGPGADRDALDASARSAVRVVPHWHAAEVVAWRKGRLTLIAGSDWWTRETSELRSGDPFPGQAGWATRSGRIPLLEPEPWAEAVRRAGCRYVDVEPLFEPSDDGFALIGYTSGEPRADVRPGIDPVALAVDLVENRLEAYALRREVVEVQAAMDSNRRIGVALGIIVERLRVTEQEAFSLLRRASQDRNVKLRDIAEEVLLTGRLDGHPDGGHRARTSRHDGRHG